MTTFAAQHERLLGLFNDKNLPFIGGAVEPQYAGRLFVKQASVELSGRVMLTATCHATQIDRMYTAKSPQFDADVESGVADMVFDNDLNFFPCTRVRLLRGWSSAQAEADDAAGRTLAVYAAHTDGTHVGLTPEQQTLMHEAAETFEPLAFLKNPEQSLTPQQLAEHIGWLTTFEPSR